MENIPINKVNIHFKNKANDITPSWLPQAFWFWFLCIPGFILVNKDNKKTKPKQLFLATLTSVFYTDLDNKQSAFSPPLTAFVMQTSKNHDHYITDWSNH